MKKLYRVKKNQEFQRIMGVKRFVSCPVLTVYYTPKREAVSRVGLSVGKKLGGAVQRNLVKRQVRMMVQDLTEFKENFDCIILIRGAYLKQSFEQNKKELEKCLNTVRIKMQSL
jgi:ribonuclease P protein component